MKTYYAIHNDKTHVKVESLVDFVARFGTESDWKMVEADSEGWIKHEGNECPLPDDARCDLRFYDHRQRMCEQTRSYPWGDAMGRIITHYRPILAEKVQEPEPALPADCIETPDLFNRLDVAHQAAAQIPDIIAQIKAKLEQYGYTVVPLSPFVAAEFVEPEPAVETPQANALCTPSVTDALVYGTSVMKNGKHVPLKDFYAEPAEDMPDWRNWREGDLVECLVSLDDGLHVGIKHEVVKRGVDYCVVDADGDYRPLMINSYRFRFHSRPAKWEK